MDNEVVLYQAIQVLKSNNSAPHLRQKLIWKQLAELQNIYQYQIQNICHRSYLTLLLKELYGPKIRKRKECIYFKFQTHSFRSRPVLLAVSNQLLFSAQFCVTYKSLNQLISNNKGPNLLLHSCAHLPFLNPLFDPTVLD